MEMVQELFLTGVLAVLFSFIIAKLVSVAMAGDSVGESRVKSFDGLGLDRGSVVEEVKFEDRLSARGLECESRVELVEESVEQVNRIEAELVPTQDVEVEETVSEEIGVDRGDVPEKSVEEAEPIEKSPQEEKSGQCCEEEVKQGDDELVQKLSVESAHDQARVVESVELKDEEREIKKVEEEISRRDDDHEDDDWEGIERTELEKDFAVAAKFIGSEDTSFCLEGVGSDVKMQLYGLHKVATEGPCHEPQPMALMVSARAKWNAWQGLGNMSPDVAMEHYITLLSENVPGWKKENCTDATKLEAGSPCHDLSRISSEHPVPDLGDDRSTVANTGLDVAETMGKNSENMAKG